MESQGNVSIAVDGSGRECYTGGMTLRTATPILLWGILCLSVALRVVDAQSGGAVTAVELKRTQILEQQLKSPAKPASAPAGQKLYDVLCAMCHRFGSMGQDVGPDLTNVTSRFGRKELLESILWPSRTISDQYESELFETVTGKVHHGLLVRETPAALQIRTVDSSKPIVLAIADIQSRRKSRESFMPEGLIDGLSQTDTANLLAFMFEGPPKSRPEARKPDTMPQNRRFE